MGEITVSEHLLQVIDHAAAQGHDLPVRFAALVLHMSKESIEQLSVRLRVPNECRELAVMAARERDTINGALALDADAIVALCERCDGWRKPQRFAQLLQAVACDGLVAGEFAQAARLQGGLDAARGVNAGALAQACTEPKRIPDVIHAARVAAVQAFLAQA